MAGHPALNRTIEVRILARQPFFTTPIGESSNGRTSGSESDNRGSNPCSPALFKTPGPFKQEEEERFKFLPLSQHIQLILDCTSRNPI